MNYNDWTPKIRRRPKGHISSIATNFLHLRNPWITSWWSMAFPGFGHVIMGSYAKGFLLILGELIINLNSKLNLAILYSFNGEFERAKDVLDKRWALLYIGVYTYAIWDSYRSTVDLNKLSILADREKAIIIPIKISSLEINYLDKRNPWVGAVWSIFMPGAGHLYTHRIPTGFIVIVSWVILAYYSHLLECVIFTAVGDFSQAIASSYPQWLLFMPSFYGFSIYDAYITTVEYNKLFCSEQAEYFKENYQNINFKMPV